MRIGVISDTHGLLRPEAVRALSGVAQIIHAGDVGGPEVFEGLRSIAPIHAVRGNNDRDAWSGSLPLRLSLDVAGVRILVLHDLNELDAESETGGYRVVVAGHSHKPAVVERDGILFVNPGSAGPRRFRLPVTIGYITLAKGAARAEIRNLELPR
ncbi:MAG: metallophosphoesterase family protein [Steroidobacteraceae bacterium]